LTLPRRVLTLAVLAYLLADYSDPSQPGVFSLASESLFVDSVEARAGTPSVTAPLMCAVVPVRRVFAAAAPPRVIVTARPAVRPAPYSPRADVTASPPSPPDSSEDH
jgi:hypothetical protein